MRFQPTYLSEFADDILVRCPRCNRCAHLKGVELDAYPWADRRLICGHCGYFRDWVWKRDGSGFTPSACSELGYGIEVWLKTSCCGETLWAYNEDHIAYLERFVAAKIRDCAPDPNGGHMNRSLESRLPKWMLAGKNRESVLKGLSALRAMLPEGAD